MAVRPSGAVQRLPGAPVAQSGPHRIGHITLGVKRTGVRSAGKPPAPFDVAGVGDGLTAGRMRHSQRKRGATASPFFSPQANQIGLDHTFWPAVGPRSPRAHFIEHVTATIWLPQSALLPVDTEHEADRAHPERGAACKNTLTIPNPSLSIARAETPPTAHGGVCHRPE